MGDLLKFYADPSNNFGGETIAFLQVCVVSVVIATLIGVALGALVSRNAFLSFLAVNLSGLLRAIPIIAFLIAVVPYLGVGFTPSVTALIILGIPPVLLNTYTGLRGIDPATIDAAKGMGMTTWQIIQRIQAPLVLPVVAAGIRTATVQIVATAPLAALIGGGGYGDYITDGLYTLRNVEILAGAIPVALIALFFEIFLGWLQRRLTPAGLQVQSTVEVARL